MGREDARGAVGAFEECADAGEVKGFVAQHGADGDAAGEVGTFFDPLDELSDVGAGAAARYQGAGLEPRRVERFPEFGGQGAAHGAGVFARGAQAAENAAAVVTVEADKLEHGARFHVLVLLLVGFFHLQGGHGGAQGLRQGFG